MITYVEGDLFQSPAKVLVNTVNTVGVMGKGIALQFKQIYPEMFKKYQSLCEKKQLNIGDLWLYKTPHKWILNFPTKKHWRSKSKVEYIDAGLRKFVETYQEKDIRSISFPMLGCGNGELNWESQVRPLMEKHLSDLPIEVFIHVVTQNQPQQVEHNDIRAMRDWLRGSPETLGYVEFLDDLLERIHSQSRFYLINSSIPFEVETNEDHTSNLAFTILTERNTRVDITRDDLLELWQYIRAAGYSNGELFPLGLHQYADYIIAILSHLPYLNAVRISAEGLNSMQTYGLQLVSPVAAEPQSIMEPKAITLL
jgi:O-acetyl-ADP-ribose deacetylase (regulator of RNase III)